MQTAMKLHRIRTKLRGWTKTAQMKDGLPGSRRPTGGVGRRGRLWRPGRYLRSLKAWKISSSAGQELASQGGHKHRTPQHATTRSSTRQMTASQSRWLQPAAECGHRQQQAGAPNSKQQHEAEGHSQRQTAARNKHRQADTQRCSRTQPKATTCRSNHKQ